MHSLYSLLGVVLLLAAVESIVDDDWDRLQKIYQLEWQQCTGRGKHHPVCRKLRLRYPSPLLSSNLMQYEITVRGISYGIRVDAGTEPGEMFLGLLDTGSALTWLISPSCNSTCDTVQFPDCSRTCETDVPKYHRHRFHFNSSQSFHTNYTSFEHPYGIGRSVAAGFLGKDRIVAFGKRSEAQDLLVATNLTFLNLMSFDGFVGLAYPRKAPTTPLSLLESLKDVAVFTLYLKRVVEVDADEGGFLSLGVDTINCFPGIAWTELINLDDEERNFGNKWQFLMTNYTYPGYEGEEHTDVRAIVDSGTTHVVADPVFIDEFVTSCGGEYEPLCGLYKAPCNSTFLDLVFYMAGREWRVKPEQYLLPREAFPNCKVLPAGTCVVAVDGLFGKDLPEVILGQPFLRSYCSIHDVAQAKVGFTPSRH